MIGESRTALGGGRMSVGQIEHELGKLRTNDDGTLALRSSVLNMIVVTDEVYEHLVFDGEHALAYVRSRHYDFEDPPGSGNWQEDPASDLGRVSRQQDFIRRTLSSVLDEGPLNPRVARGLIRSTTSS